MTGILNDHCSISQGTEKVTFRTFLLAVKTCIVRPITTYWGIEMQRAIPTNSQLDGQESRTDRVMRINKFCEGLGIGRSTYYKLLGEGKIEPPLRISKRARGHMESYFNRLTKTMKEHA